MFSLWLVVAVAPERVVAATIHPAHGFRLFIHGPSITRCVCHLTFQTLINGPASWDPLEKEEERKKIIKESDAVTSS